MISAKIYFSDLPQNFVGLTFHVLFCCFCTLINTRRRFINCKLDIQNLFLILFIIAVSLYVVGKFIGTCSFNPAGGGNLTSNGGLTDGDGFVAKYDVNGNYQWAFGLGGSGNDRTMGLTVDGNHDVIVSGFFSNTVDFDPGSGTANMTSTQYNSYFAKYTREIPDIITLSKTYLCIIFKV